MESQLPPLTAERPGLGTTLGYDHLGINPHTPEQRNKNSPKLSDQKWEFWKVVCIRFPALSQAVGDEG